MYIQSLIEGEYFHIYNRGVNGEDLFKEKKNYYYFLEQYKYYCAEILETLAYCLLKNHFHLTVRVKENMEVPRHDGKGMFRLNASKQLGHLFNSYAQSINPAYRRTGPLFESPFERKLIEDDSHLVSAIHYCHWNPVHHGFVADPRDWEFSSYRAISANDNTIIAVDKPLSYFGNIDCFQESHRTYLMLKDPEKYIIES